MSFQKQVLVLKDVFESPTQNKKSLVGIARIEIDNGVAELFLSLVNVPLLVNAKYYLWVIDHDQTIHSFELGASPISTVKVFENMPSIEKGVSVGIYAVKDQLPLTIAFSKSENGTFTLSQFKKTVAEKQLEQIKQKRQKERDNLNCAEKPVQQEPLDALSLYNDEAVATENYFAFDKVKGDKKPLKDFENAPNKDELLNCSSPQKTKQERAYADCVQNETNACSSTQKPRPTYYFERAKQELENIFSKFPEETPLQKLFTDSKWAKINYSPDKYYVVGLIKEKGIEKYICYGVPATYSPTPPEQLKGFCSFVPNSIFNMNGKGYWMLFQDALSGKCILHE